LKPANIKLRPDGAVKVLDFGLAKALDPLASDARELGPSISPTITAATQLGMILGTAAYMSPEQAKGKPVDKRADNWAFGCLLYEMLTGQRAFPGDDITEVIAFVITKEPDWTALPRTTPAPIHRLLRRCLQKDRKQRLADIADARLDVEEARAAKSGAVEPASGRQRAGWNVIVPWVLAAAALIALGVLAGPWRALPAVPIPQVARFSIPLPEGQQAAFSGRGNLALSPDGTMAAYTLFSQLYVRRLSEFDFKLLFNTEFPTRGSGVNSPTFSPDGQWLAFHSDRAVWRVQTAGGMPVRVCDALAPFGMSWHSSGIVVGQGAQGVVRCRPEGGPPESLVTVAAGEEAHGPDVLPDGDGLIYTVAKITDGLTRWDNAQIVVQSLASRDRRMLIARGTDGRYVEPGYLLYALGGTVFAIPFDAARRELRGGAVPVIEGVRRSISATTGVAQYATSKTGTLLYLPGPPGMATDERVLAVSNEAGVITPFKIPSGPYVHVRTARDGRHVAIGSDDGKDAIVWLYRLDGSRSLQRLRVQHRNRLPIWAPDGERIAYQSNREGDLAIFVQRIDGTGMPMRLTTAAQGEEHIPESWSPDGNHFLFSVAKNDRYSVQVLSIANKTTTPFPNGESAEPLGAVFSPDGRWVAYSVGVPGAVRGPNRGVFVQPFPPNGQIYQAPQRSLDFHPLWSPSGRELIFVPTAASRQFATVPITLGRDVSFGDGKFVPARVTAGRTSGQLRAHDILPDGRFIGLINPAEADTTQAAGSELRVVLNWFEELKQRVPPIQ
jgi:serine/threonine-protein kinase